ncbi:hypothetical protein PR001_g19678 [Phytophthora rubi]|uniref:Uncharacterized protein n=2 Tax=Phytophthora rubi TaxID=129364 RepID=A0A6A3JQH0_9STRA|nr:hypothetical protein PR001_g19678 [Phytophthora rubi]
MARVVSCRFLRLGCSEDEHPLFRREYARSNREKGVKAQLQGLSLAVCLLRCFPHCCPEHVKRSYCGCSVHLLVTFSADVTAALDQVAVVTRFEPSQVAPLWPASLAGLFRDVGAAGDDDSCRHCCDCTSLSTTLGPDRKAHGLRVPARATGDCS